MAEVNAHDTRIITTSEDVIESYCCTGENAMTGVEVEICFFDPNKPGMPIMSPPQNTTVMNIAVEKHGGGAFNNEPSSDLLEANSIPEKFENLQIVFDDIHTKLQTLTDEAAKLGLKRSYFQDLPHISHQELLNNIVEIERYQAFFNPPRADMMDIAVYFTAAKSTQVSISYKEYDHMLSNVRRLYLLAPFLFMLTDNSSGFNDAKPFSGHHGMHHRSSLGARGSFPPYIFTAANGEEYIKSHIDQAMNNQLYVYYDEEGTLHQLPSGTWWTFNKDLKERGLNTAANYYLAQSILWPDVKIAPLTNDQGEITHHRYEARMFGVGIHQPQTALLIVGGLAFNEEFALEIDHLLQSQGLCTLDAPGCIQKLQRAYGETRRHDGKFFDIKYGDQSMASFAIKFAKILEKHFQSASYNKALTPILKICNTGWSDSRVNQYLCDEMDKAKDFLKSYDPALFENPNNCGALIFKDKLPKI